MFLPYAEDVVVISSLQPHSLINVGALRSGGTSLPSSSSAPCPSLKTILASWITRRRTCRLLLCHKESSSIEPINNRLMEADHAMLTPKRRELTAGTGFCAGMWKTRGVGIDTDTDGVRKWQWENETVEGAGASGALRYVWYRTSVVCDTSPQAWHCDNWALKW